MRIKRMVTGVLVIAVGIPVGFVALNVALMVDGAELSHWRSEESRLRFEKTYAETLALMPEPVETHDVETSFGVVRAYRFERQGADAAYRARDPLVLLPGHSAPVPMWQGTVSDLYTDRAVVAIDLLGQPGMSVPTRKVVDSADQAQWLEETLAGMGLERVHLVGVSFGGWTAMNHATRHPARVASVSLFDPVMVFSRIPGKTMVAAMLTEFPLMPDRYDDWFMSWTAGGAPVDESVPEARIIGAGIEGYSVVQPAPAPIPEAALGELDVPVQAFIAGRSVMHVDPAAAAEVARVRLRRGVVVVKPEATHAIHGEHAKELNARVREFVSRRR
ncbi:alpha/beta fold hydrolase [Propioniferax innocua]|uniref:Pimeloyl-ACP methyl ester carboxylesterase n=1 Tax=Propioniferax innocua TaxID=1753 RepID=A0A542ZQH3_9ACTN|nr:alpha/beta hydrolase [Propioniferax innocua]TQL62605.1 pimeloyl-ACP methyl ester carboxylesterase [Propioniferax innocua]